MKMTNEQILAMAQIALPDRIPLKMEIRDIVNKLSVAFEVSAADQQKILDILLAKQSSRLALFNED